MSAYQRCVLILADGARPDVLLELSQQGVLPHCEKLFIKQGHCGEAIGVFPSTTGPAYLPYLTGCYPGTCNMPGIRWFDKKVYGAGKPFLRRFRSYVGLESLLMNSDIELAHPTAFQFFKKPTNIFSALNKGSTFQSNKTKQMRLWYWYYSHMTDHWAVADDAATKKLLTSIEEGSDFTFVVFPGIDEYSHLSHPHSEQVLQAYHRLDGALGLLIERLEKKRWLDSTLIVIVSDHGLTQTFEHFEVSHFLEERGLKTFYYPKILKKNFEAASMVSGNGMAHLYFRDQRPQAAQKGWEKRLSFEELEKQQPDCLQALIEQPAVDLAAAQLEDGSLVAFNHRGRARIAQEGDQISYQVLQGADPFGYSALPARLSDRESLEKTFETEYPDALMQLLQIFRSPRTGDCVISAKKGYDFRYRFEHPEHRSTHGALIREQIAVPFLINVPGIPRFARSCDVFPTILQLMGKSIPASVDGISLVA